MVTVKVDFLHQFSNELDLCIYAGLCNVHRCSDQWCKEMASIAVANSALYRCSQNNQLFSMVGHLFQNYYLICAMNYLVCAMNYLVCAMNYLVCAMNYLVCAMNYLVCAMNYLVCAMNYLVFSMNYLICSMNYLICSMDHLVYSMILVFYFVDYTFANYIFCIGK